MQNEISKKEIIIDNISLPTTEEKTMVKNCEVLINNEAVTVVNFDGVVIQLPSIHKAAKSVLVEYEGGLYKVIDDKEVVNKKNKNKKKSEKEVALSE